MALTTLEKCLFKDDDRVNDTVFFRFYACSNTRFVMTVKNCMVKPKIVLSLMLRVIKNLTLLLLVSSSNSAGCLQEPVEEA